MILLTGYFLEDGVETGNLFDGNLGVFAVCLNLKMAVLLLIGLRKDSSSSK